MDPIPLSPIQPSPVTSAWNSELYSAQQQFQRCNMVSKGSLDFSYSNNWIGFGLFIINPA